MPSLQLHVAVARPPSNLFSAIPTESCPFSSHRIAPHPHPHAYSIPIPPHPRRHPIPSRPIPSPIPSPSQLISSHPSYLFRSLMPPHQATVAAVGFYESIGFVRVGAVARYAPLGTPAAMLKHFPITGRWLATTAPHSEQPRPPLLSPHSGDLHHILARLRHAVSLPRALACVT